MRTAIVIFSYNRNRHLFRCLSSLISNYEFRSLPVEIYIDGPKNIEDEEQQRRLIETIEWFNVFHNIRIHHRRENFGLARSVITGLDEVFVDYDSAIVIEDDLELSPYFLDFCLQGLKLYVDDLQVASIHGHLPNLDLEFEFPFFLRGADCWGWATWRNRWNAFESSEAKLLLELEDRDLIRDFDLDNAYPYFEMLKRQFRMEIDSWAIRWHASMYLLDKLTLYPNISLVRNTGRDGSGTHYKSASARSNFVSEELASTPIRLVRQNIEINYQARESFKRYLKRKETSPKKLKSISQLVISKVVRKFGKDYDKIHKSAKNLFKALQ